MLVFVLFLFYLFLFCFTQLKYMHTIYENRKDRCSYVLGYGRGMLYCMAMDCLKVDKWPKNPFEEIRVNKLSFCFVIIST